tara:strand:- start:105 stop:377 length:273 start_codon:yes stop_codon:yes gene_type:complete
MKNFPWITKLTFMVVMIIITIVIFYHTSAYGKTKKARFYDFSDQLISGEIKKPTAIYMESRARAKFAKLLRLKKSFRRALILSYNDPLLK